MLGLEFRASRFVGGSQRCVEIRKASRVRECLERGGEKCFCLVGVRG